MQAAGAEGAHPATKPNVSDVRVADSLRLADYVAQSAAFNAGLQMHFSVECCYTLLDRLRPCVLVFLATWLGDGRHQGLALVEVVHSLNLGGLSRRLARLERDRQYLDRMTSLPALKAIACAGTSRGNLPLSLCRVGSRGQGAAHVISVDEFCEEGRRFALGRGSLSRTKERSA